MIGTSGLEFGHFVAGSPRRETEHCDGSRKVDFARLRITPQWSMVSVQCDTFFLNPYNVHYVCMYRVVSEYLLFAVTTLSLGFWDFLCLRCELGLDTQKPCLNRYDISKILRHFTSPTLTRHQCLLLYHFLLHSSHAVLY